MNSRLAAKGCMVVPFLQALSSTSPSKLLAAVMKMSSPSSPVFSP